MTNESEKPFGSGGGIKPRRIFSCNSFWASVRFCLRNFLRSPFVNMTANCTGSSDSSALIHNTANQSETKKSKPSEWTQWHARRKPVNCSKDFAIYRKLPHYCHCSWIKDKTVVNHTSQLASTSPVRSIVYCSHSRLYWTSGLWRLKKSSCTVQVRWGASEYIVNGTSAQLGYTVPFTLVDAGKYRTEDTLKIQIIQKLNITQTKNAFYGTRYLPHCCALNCSNT